jgi:hypothetical protein
MVDSNLPKKMAPQASKLVALPRTAPRHMRQHTHLNLIKRITPRMMNWEIDGTILCPGALIAAEKLGPHPVVLECAGPYGEYRFKRHGRDTLWVLWRYDWTAEKWIELMRCVSRDWTFKLSMREATIQALRAGELVDVSAQAGAIADEVMTLIDVKLKFETVGVAQTALNYIKDSVCGRLAWVEQDTDAITRWGDVVSAAG